MDRYDLENQDEMEPNDFLECAIAAMKFTLVVGFTMIVVLEILKQL